MLRVPSVGYSEELLKDQRITINIFVSGVPSVFFNSSSSPSFSSIASSLTSPEPAPVPPEPPEPEPEYYLGDLISGTYCSRIFSDCDRKHCRLQSPNFPGIYPRNLTCYYAVRQHEIPPGKHALITVRQPKGQLIQIRSESALHGTASTHELRVWESCDDVQDYVVIYDGYTTRDPVILKFCGGGEPVPKTVSSGHELLVEFSTSPYGTFLQPSPPKSLHGFQLEVEVEFVDQQAPSYMRQKKNCEFWVRGTDKGVIESPVHSLPANTTCLYHFQGLDAAVSPSPVPYRPMNARYPDWRHMGMILPPPRYRVWLSVVKFHAGGSWDPKQTEQVCRSYLNVWDGQLWTPSNCDGLYCGTREKPRGRTGSSIATGKKNVTLLARFCKERVPRSCEHSLLANDTRYPRPCSLAESFLTSGDSLTLELKLADSSALRPVTFKALYEFVDLHVDGEPFGDGPCSRKFGYTTSNKVPDEGISTANEEERQQKFRSPRDVFLYGRGGARNLSCVYRFESPPDLRVKLTLTSVVVLRRRCETRSSGGRLECVGEMTPSATVSLHEKPWPDVPPVERHCLCHVRSQTLLPFTYVSASNVVEIRFNVVGMNASDDFDTLSFEGSWKFIKTPSCSKDLRYKGASGQLIFTHPPHHSEANCESNPRVIVPSSNKYLYVKIKGLIMKHSSRMGNNTIRTVNTGQRCDIATRIIVHTALYTAVICPTPNSYRDHLVEVFSEGWHLKSDQNHVIIRDMAFDKLEIDRLGKELPRTIAIEFYGKEEGEYVVNWLELTRRRDIPPNGLSLFLMKTDDCRYRCPELDACINPSVWCDGVEDCPSGVDEALSHCSLLLNLPPLYLALGISGLIVAL
nr:unnamed protein product [Callosobruchus chinensis]